MVVRRTRSHEVAQRSFVKREKTGAQATFGGQPDPVARRAEGLAHRRDESDTAGSAIGELEAGCRSGPRVRDRGQREEILDLLLDAQARNDLLVGPDAITV